MLNPKNPPLGLARLDAYQKNFECQWGINREPIRD